MLDFQQKRKLRSFLYNRWTLGFLGVVLLLTVRSTWDVNQKQRESANLLHTAEVQSSALQSREQDLDQKIAELQTPEGLEAEIRAKFNVAKPDENVAVVLDSDDSSASTSTTTVSFWQQILNFFK